MVKSEIKDSETENFLWHSVDDKERVKIKEEAKKIMDNFGKALDKLNHKDGFVFVEREHFTREEGKGAACDPEFKKIMFENAPMKNKNSILAERGKWI